jgi:hypothetical protein
LIVRIQDSGVTWLSRTAAEMEITGSAPMQSRASRSQYADNNP